MILHIDALLRVKRARGAPHKPLLLLSTLDHYRKGSDRLIPYASLEQRFKELAAALPDNKKISMQEPFWRLKNDGVWEVESTGSSSSSTGERSPKSAVRGGLTVDISEEVRRRGIAEQMERVLQTYFDPPAHESLRATLGL